MLLAQTGWTSAANDIPAEITTSAGRTTTDPLTGATELAQSDEFPIAITDPEKMEAARELLATAQAMAARLGEAGAFRKSEILGLSGLTLAHAQALVRGAGPGAFI